MEKQWHITMIPELRAPLALIPLRVGWEEQKKIEKNYVLMTANQRVEAILHSRATLHNRATLHSNSTHPMEESNLLLTLAHQVCLILHTRQRTN